MWLEYHNILFLLDTLVLRCPAGESLVGYRLSLYPLSPQLHWSARIRMHWFRSGSGVWQHLNWNIFSLLPPNIGLIFKTMWKFPHDSPSDFIQTKIVPTSTTNKLDLTIRATSSRYKGLFNNVHQWHQSPISVNWCPSSLFLKDFVHTNFVNIWSGLQRSYKMSQSYVLSNIQTFTWE